MSTPKATFHRLLAQMKGLPTLPASLARLNQILDDPSSSASDVSEAIAVDQSVATKVLKVVNSPYYGFPRRVETLNHAVAVLGYRPLKELILVTSIFERVTEHTGECTLDRRELWAHAVGTGVAARVLARLTGQNAGDAVFLSGLLHDIGKVLLDAYLHDEYRQAVALAGAKNMLLLEAEQQVLGADHTDFGFWLAEEWHLPQGLASAVLYHHDPSQAQDHYILACLVHMGDILSRSLEIGNGGDETIPGINHEAWVALGMNSQILEKAVEEVFVELARNNLGFLEVGD